MKDPIHGLSSTFNKVGALTVAIRIMIWYQNEIFASIKKLRDGRTGADRALVPHTDINCPSPNFETVSHAMDTGNFNVFPEIPESWMERVRDDAPDLQVAVAIRGGGRNPDGEPAEKRRKVMTNHNVDKDVKKRFAASDFTMISPMRDKWQGSGTFEESIPKYKGNGVCLTWGIKGECTENCKRKESHVNNGPAINRGLMTLMDGCCIPAV